MINLSEILSSQYADKNVSDIENWLQQHALLIPFKRSVAQLNRVLTNERNLDIKMKTLPIGHIASNLLLLCNQQVFEEKDISRKQEMEIILSDICVQILKKFFSYVHSNIDPLINQLSYALNDTCEFYGYDFTQLISFLKLEQEVSYKRALKNAENLFIPGKIPYLYWNGKSSDKQLFLQIFTEQKLTPSKRGLRDLFGTPNGPLKIRMDKNKAELLLQFFHSLSKKRLISAGGTRGIYRALAFHVLDFENNFLLGKEAKRCISSLKQSRRRWAANQERIDKWLQKIEVRAGL